jgi:precorrin-2 dehydrogenase/sirohydrochlorin ferrochelatase
MARQLRKKIQSIITAEDILEIELQDYARSLLKDSVENQKERRDYLYSIFEDEKINDFIKNNQIDEAKLYIDNLIRGL